MKKMGVITGTRTEYGLLKPLIDKIYRAPSLGIPTVNIGDRQKGRVHGETVIDCGNDKKQITLALEKALSPEFRVGLSIAKNPYEGERTSDTILEIIDKALRDGIDMKKRFYDIVVE